MTDKRQSDPSHVTIPPELKPFMGVEKFPEVEHDPAVAAVFAALAEPEPQQIDSSRGVGNLQAYVGVVELPEREGETSTDGEPKVALGMEDVPRALPPGNRSAPTEEISVRAFRDPAAESAPPSNRAKDVVSRTVGGRTERLPVPVIDVEHGNGGRKEASPWTKDTPSVRAEELPSSLRPASERAGAEEIPAGVPRRRLPRTGTMLTIALLLVGAFVGWRALTTPRARTPGAEAREPAPPAPSLASPPSAFTVAAPLAAVPSAATSVTSRAEAPAPPHASSAPDRPRVAPKPSSTADDPYADAAVKPTPTVVTPPAKPPEAPHLAPVPGPSSAPGPDGDGEFFHRPKPKSP